MNNKATTTSKRTRDVYPTNEIAHLWAHATQARARNGGRNTFFFEDATIYSYGHHFPIARRVQTARKGVCYLFTTREYSVTTCGHKSKVQGAIPEGAQVFTVDRVGKGVDDQAENVTGYLADIKRLVDRVPKALGRAGDFVRQAEKRQQELFDYAKWFGIRRKLSVLPKDWVTIRTAALERSARANKAQAEKNARAKAAQDEARAKAEADFETVYAEFKKTGKVAEGVNVPYSYKWADRYAEIEALVQQNKLVTQQREFDAVYAAWKAGGTIPEYIARVDGREDQRAEIIAAQNIENIAAWKAGSTIRLDYDLPAFGRIAGGELETSLGARVPLEHVRKVLPLVLDIIAKGKIFKRNGHTIHLGHYQLNEILADGTVIVGCHRFAKTEVLRIAELVAA